MSINEILKDVESEILGRRGDGIKALFESQISAAETHLATARVLSLGDTAPACPAATRQSPTARTNNAADRPLYGLSRSSRNSVGVTIRNLQSDAGFLARESRSVSPVMR